MNVTTTHKGNKIIARAGNRQHTEDVNPDLPVAASHGRAAQRLVTKVAPGYRRMEILNSVKVVKSTPTKTTYNYKD